MFRKRGTQIHKVTGVLVGAGACIILIWYIQSHTLAFSKLKNVSLIDVAIVNLLYVASILALAMNLNEVTRFAGKRIALYEALLVTIYSSWANYLIPCQSGPGFRAVYLKARHGVPVKVVMLGTFAYLLWLAAISTCMVLYASFTSGGRGALLVAVAILIVVSVTIARHKAGTAIQMKERFAAHIRLVVATGVLTLVQLFLIGVIYYVELTAIDTQISIAQTAGYAGIANLSLLVAITPGAIGIREAFLAISQGIHNIPVETIAAASAVDRASYLVLLAEMSIFIVLSHAKHQFRLGE